LFSRYLGQSEANIIKMFKDGMTHSPCLLFLDECESLTRERGQDGNQNKDSIVSQILQEIDTINKDTKNTVFFMCATNHPSLLCSALLSRMSMKVEVPTPNVDDRKKMFFSAAPSLTDLELEEVSLSTEGYSCRDIQGIFFY
jgi:SpoVK/Ycf46/Vps4 family AAA+-type ATPase